MSYGQGYELIELNAERAKTAQLEKEIESLRAELSNAKTALLYALFRPEAEDQFAILSAKAFDSFVDDEHTGISADHFIYHNRRGWDAALRWFRDLMKPKI
jgi:hypothetical protein